MMSEIPKSKNIIAIIPARGGSKGILRKNLVEFDGLPLVACSIKHALSSQNIQRVLVSTDDPEIRECALSYGAEAPFLRPEELAHDHVLDLPVFQHALDYLSRNEGYVPDIVLHLRPTAPYRKVGWIDAAIELLVQNPAADSVRSVSEPDKHPYRMFSIAQDGYLHPIIKDCPHPYLLRRQDLPPVFYYNCVIDVTRHRTITTMQSMTGRNILPFILNSNDVIDIDTLRDLEIARFLFENRS